MLLARIGTGSQSSSAQAIDLDGTNDYLSRASDFTGNADGKTFTFSAWVWLNNGGAANQRIYRAQDGTNFGFIVDITGGQVVITAQNSAGSGILSATVTSPQISTQTFLHILVSVDLANASNRAVYINDVAATVTWTTYTNDTIDFTRSAHYIGTLPTLATKITGRLAHVYLDYTYRDLSNSSNRRLFITADRKPATVSTDLENLLTYSEQFDNAAWVQTATTTTANATTAPDGTVSADKLIPSTANSSHFIGQNGPSFVSGTTYTFSMYAKAGGYDHLRMAFSTSAFPVNNRGASFNITTGTVGTVQSGVTATITAVGSGWYRCTITATATASAVDTVFFNSQNADSATSLTFVGDGSSGAFIWGAQLRTGTSAGTYAKTESSPVYRPILYLPMTDPSTCHVNSGTGGNMSLNGTIARSGRGPNQFNAAYSDLDGSADYLSRTTVPTGLVDGKAFTLTFTANIDVTSTITPISFCTSTTERFLVQFNGGTMFVDAYSSAGASVLSFTVAGFAVGRNYNVAISCDLSDVAKRRVYVNGSAASVTWTTYSNTNIHFNIASTPGYFIGKAGSAAYFNGRLGEVFFHTSYIDLSVAANLAKFVTGTGIDAKPADLGANGELPLGTSPLIYLPMYGNDAGNNRGTGGAFTVNSGPFVGSRGPNEFFGNKADFDGSTGHLARTSALTGASDGKTFSCSFVLNGDVNTGGTVLHTYESAASGIKIFINSAKMTIQAWNSAGTKILDVNFLTTLAASTQYFIQICVDLANSSNRHIYVNNVADTPTWGTYTNDSIDFTKANSYIGATNTGAASDYLDGKLAEFFFTTGYIDFSQEANRLKFRDAFGNPVSLGTDGKTPTGTAPLIYMRFPPDSKGTNAGTGGAFSVNGTISDAGQL